MRVLFTIWPGGAHLHPMVSLAYALRGAGHEVVVATHPFYVDAIAAVGLTAVALGNPGNMPIPKGPGRPHRAGREHLQSLNESLDLDVTDTYRWHVFSQFLMPAVWDFHPTGATAADARPGVDDLVEFAKFWEPDLVVWDACWPSGAIAAKACGAAHARLNLGPDLFGWSTELFAGRNSRPGVELGADPLTDALTPLAERHGVEVDKELLLGQWTIDVSPKQMQIPVDTRTLFVRWVPFNGAAVLPDWLRARPERPRVALSLGMSNRAFFSPEAERQTKDLLEMVSELDVELVATLNDAQLSRLPEIPANVRTIDYVPLTDLLPSTSAIIHHGGIGSFSAAAAARVPQLITDTEGATGSFWVEEDGETWTMETGGHVSSPFTSAYVNEAGAGVTLNYQKLSVAEMRKSLLQVLTEPSYQEGAERIYRDLLLNPTPADVVPHLERLTAEHRTR
ncbi:nucleotide disphospho-sugar-binding domain-containing protein [Amycolatopsis sp. H20-H5]|uniref:nucleotide disphospho-sugar-binding domain-containing protein n=1 Tax=Amycolatopsis sp. H20-H5 TaxID=3046309 RepID=UPI002DB8325F|nr:nucleotide disphospho-sugar-binding domain-containing protein [Amycolatopsis sp. H20-H5]MEC3976898.1 nucleotide disphospho-sugar-binding domain-containing protein [Amycolatopsis sp. H20-H5]